MISMIRSAFSKPSFHDYHLLNEDSIISILGICFNADIFPLVMVHVKSIFNLCVAILEKSDLIIIACIPMQLKQCETIHRCLQITPPHFILFFRVKLSAVCCRI